LEGIGVRRDFAKRLTVLEAKAKPPMISTWVDFAKWVDEHGDEDIDVELSPELQKLMDEAGEEVSQP
jgi:hypothetical protein